MNPVPNTAPLSSLRHEQDSVLSMMDHEPVILTSRSEPRAVLVSVEEWNAISEQLVQLQALQKYLDRKSEFAQNPPTVYTLDEVMAKIGMVK